MRFSFIRMRPISWQCFKLLPTYLFMNDWWWVYYISCLIASKYKILVIITRVIMEVSASRHQDRAITFNVSALNALLEYFARHVSIFIFSIIIWAVNPIFYFQDAFSYHVGDDHFFAFSNSIPLILYVILVIHCFPSKCLSISIQS